MATLQVKIEPFEVPYTVFATVGAETVGVPIKELDAETVATLIEEFSAAVMEQLAK